jgi:uncharacterized protein
MLAENIPITPEQIADFCRRHHIRRMAFFGSVLRSDFRPHSDVDVLVEFEEGHSPGWDIVLLEEEFSGLCGGHGVDFINPRYLNRWMRKSILEAAEVQYAAD